MMLTYGHWTLDIANPPSVDETVVKNFSSRTLQIDELQDTLPEHVRKGCLLVVLLLQQSTQACIALLLL